MGRKRSIITDPLGLLLAVLVTAAGVQDSTATRTLLEQAAADHPSLRKVSTAATANTSSSMPPPRDPVFGLEVLHVHRAGVRRRAAGA